MARRSSKEGARTDKVVAIASRCRSRSDGECGQVWVHVRCSGRRSAWQGPGQESFDAHHLSMPTMRAVTQRNACEAKTAVTVVPRLGAASCGTPVPWSI